MAATSLGPVGQPAREWPVQRLHLLRPALKLWIAVAAVEVEEIAVVLAEVGATEPEMGVETFPIQIPFLSS